MLGAVPFLSKIHQEPYDFFRYTHFMLTRFFKESGFSESQVVSLGTPFDLYKTVQRRLFSQIYNSDLNFFSRPLIKISEGLIKLTNVLLGPLYRKIKPSMKFTEGYGFKAYK